MPEVKGLSDNIRAISIVDKYLEHARLILFYNGGKEKAFILSADWMTRNLSRRVEVGIPIQDKTILNTLKNTFSIQWKDKVKARNLNLEVINQRVSPSSPDETDLQTRSQVALYNFYASQNETQK